MVVAQGGRGDAAGEIEEAAPGRVVQGVPLAVVPAALEVAAQDGGEVWLGEGPEVAGGDERGVRLIGATRTRVAGRCACHGGGGG